MYPLNSFLFDIFITIMLQGTLMMIANVPFQAHWINKMYISQSSSKSITVYFTYAFSYWLHIHQSGSTELQNMLWSYWLVSASLINLKITSHHITSESNDVVFDITANINENETRLKLLHHINSIQYNTIYQTPILSNTMLPNAKLWNALYNLETKIILIYMGFNGLWLIHNPFKSFTSIQIHSYSFILICIIVHRLM